MIGAEAWYADRRMNLRSTLQWTIVAATLVATGFASTTRMTGELSTPSSSSSASAGFCGDGIRQSNEICLALSICDPAPGFVCCPQDCADSSASAASGTPANCADGIDNDGDGFTDGLKTAAAQKHPFTTADAVRDAINALGGSRVPTPVRPMEFGCGSNAFGATSDAGFCAGLGYDGFEGAVCSYSACGAGGNPKVEANAYWSGPQVIRDDCNTWYQKNNTTWHNYLSSVTCLDKPACGDGRDNDFDGNIDMQDTGCASPDDDSEAQHDTSCDSGTWEGALQVNECDDGIDNDGDGKIDRTQTSSLSTRLFTSPGEIAAAINALGSARVPTPLGAMEFGCGSNGLGTASDAGFCGLLGYGAKTSNCLYSACGAGGTPKVTGNGYISGNQVLREDCNGWYLRARTTWHNYLHAAECVTGTQCSDGIDNDGDGLIDHPADIGCASQNDTSEVEADPECATGSQERPLSSRSAGSSATTAPQCKVTYAPYKSPSGRPAAIMGYANNTYLQYKENISWPDAQAQCQRAGGNLVTISSDAENAAVHALIGDNFDTWIGVNDRTTEGTYQWASGEQLSYSRWFPKQPNNYENEDCSVMHHVLWPGNAEFWGDYPCDQGFAPGGYICEIDTDCGEIAPPASSVANIDPISCLQGGNGGPAVATFASAERHAFEIIVQEPTTTLPEQPTGKEFKNTLTIVNVTSPQGSPRLRLRFVNPETKAKITVPGNTLRILVGRKTAGSGAIIGRSYDYTGQQVEEWRSTSLQGYLSFSLWHISEVEIFAEDGGAFYFDNVGYGPLECMPVTQAYSPPSSSSRVSSNRSSVRSSSLASSLRSDAVSASSQRSSAKKGGNSSRSSAPSVSSSKGSALSGLSSSRASVLPASSARNPLSSMRSVTSAAGQAFPSSVRFSLSSITLPAGTSSLSNEQLRNILSLQFPDIPTDAFFPLSDGFEQEGKQSSDGVTLDIAQAVKAKGGSSAMSALAVSWLDEWLPWRTAAPEETSSSSSSSPVATSSEPKTETAVSSSMPRASVDVRSSAQRAPQWQSSSTALTPSSSDVQDVAMTAPVTLSQDGMPLWWWVVLIVGAILGLLLGMYVTNRLLAPKEE